MTIKRIAPTLSTADVLDRVLDKGLVIDAEISIAVAGIELVTVSAFVRIASFETWEVMPSRLHRSHSHQRGESFGIAER